METGGRRRWFEIIVAGVIGAVLGSAPLAHAVRDFLKADEVLNESVTIQPNNVTIRRVSVSATVSTALSSITGVAEVFVKNTGSASICVQAATGGATCTAVCSGDYYSLAIGETLSLPVPKAAGANGAVGSVCALSSSGAQTITVVERDQ